MNVTDGAGVGAGVGLGVGVGVGGALGEGDGDRLGATDGGILATAAVSSDGGGAAAEPHPADVPRSSSPMITDVRFMVDSLS